MTPSRETSRALRRAQEDFRKDQRGVKLLLEKQKQRYDKVSRVIGEEAQVAWTERQTTTTTTVLFAGPDGGDI